MAVKVLQACVLVAALAVGGTAECTPSTRPGYKCQQAVSLGTVHYTMLHDKSKVKLAAEAPVEGFVGIGVGRGMLRSKLVAGYVRDGVPTMRVYSDITSYWDVAPTASSRATWATDYSVEEVNGMTTTSFTYDMDAIHDSATFPLVMATDDSDVFGRHDDKITFTLNLDEAREESMPVPATPAPSPTPPTPSPPTPSPTSAPTAAPLTTPSPETPPPTPLPAACNTIIITKGMKCESGYRLISEDDATRCGAALCSLLGSRYMWATMHIDSTNQQFLGSGYIASCGLHQWDGVAQMGASLCAPSDAPGPATPAPPTLPRVCTQDAACRVFGDGTANCTSSQHCACGTHSGALCEIPVAAPAPTDVHMSVSVLVTVWVPCDHAGLLYLLDTLRAEATARGAQDVSVGTSCGILSVALSGVVPNATTAATADALVDALGAAAVAHSNLTSVTHASQLDPFVQTAQTSGSHPTAVCTQDALSTVHTYDGRCLVISCNDGFALSVETRDGKGYDTCIRVPVDTPVPPPTSTPAPATPAPDTAVPAPDAGDDGLSAGAIAGIVVGCVVAVAVLAIVLVWCVRRAADSKQQEQQDEHPNEPADA